MIRQARFKLPAVTFTILRLLTVTRAVTQMDQIEGAFFGSLVADALTLGSHYEYDAAIIKKAYGGTISKYMAPGEQMGGTTHGVGWGRRNYHPGQAKGDQTDYGEYNILMLEYLAGRTSKSTRVDLKELIPVWSHRLNNKWGAWKCSQTRQTLQQVAQGAPMHYLGGQSNAMGIRFAAAFAALETENDLIHAARTMMFTHRSEEALAGGEFFARTVWRIIQKGMAPREAMEQSAKQMSPWIQTQVRKGIAKYEEAIDESRPLGKEEFVDDIAMTSMARLWDVGKTEPIKVGKASPTEGTLPSSIYIILKYGHSLEEGAKANAMVGGDSASRAVAIGMVLGAQHGVGAIPADLRNTLNAWPQCAKLLRQLPLMQQNRHDEL